MKTDIGKTIERIRKRLGIPLGGERKPLTEEERRKRARLVVYPLFVLLFAGCIWLIYSPSRKEREETVQGFNTDIPSPENRKMRKSKVDAYEEAELARKEKQRRGTFQEMVSLFDREGRDTVRLPESFAGTPPEGTSVTADAPRSSVEAYRHISRTLDNLYVSDTRDPKKEELERRIEELERQRTAPEQAGNTMEEKMALMEKSYELAAKYMNGQNGQSVPLQPEQIAQVAPSAPVQGKGNAIPVKSVSDRTVSGLQQPMSNAEFIAEYGKPRNYGFNTAVGSGYSMGKNTIRACVHNDQTLMDGQTVKLRLLEPLQAGNVIVPKNSLVSGSAKVQGERLDILVSSLEYAGNIIPVELAVYDSDGQKGLSVPSSLEQEAAKEAMANIGAGLGTSISFAQSAGQQVAMDITRGLMQGSSQYLAKKFRTVKVHLKANYQVMLYAKQ